MIVGYMRFGIGYCVLAVGALPIVLILIVILPFRALRIRVCLGLGRWLARAVLACLGVRVVWEGEPPKASEPALFVANHASTLDLFLFAVTVPVGTSVIVKKEMVYVPVLGQIAWLSGNLLIDRSNLAVAKSGLSAVAEVVKKHRMSLFVMPEGTRSKDGQIQPFKRGFVHLAMATQLPVVPLVYHGAQERWPMGAWRVDPGVVRVQVLKAMDTRTWSTERAGALADEVRSQFVEALQHHDT